jgi:hypothetical protein
MSLVVRSSASGIVCLQAEEDVLQAEEDVKV